MGAFDHATAGGHRRGADDLERRCCFGNAIGVNKSNSFFHSQPARRNAAVFQAFSNALVWALVLLPEANFRFAIAHAKGNLFVGTVILKCRADVEWAAFHGYNHREEPLTQP